MICYLADKSVPILDISVKVLAIVVCYPSVMPICPVFFGKRDYTSVGMILRHGLLIAHHFFLKPQVLNLRFIQFNHFLTSSNSYLSVNFNHINYIKKIIKMSINTRQQKRLHFRWVGVSPD